MHFALIRYGWSQPDESIYQNADIDERASFVSRTIHLWHSSQLYAQSQRIGLRSRQCQPLAAHFAIIYFRRLTYPIRNGVLVWPPLATHGCFFAGHHGKRPGQLPFADS